MRKSVVILIVAAMLFALSFGAIVYAGTTDGIDNSQILVTKEYFDSEISKLKKSIDAISTSSSSVPVITEGSSTGDEFIVLEKLSKGQIVVGGASTEMILRSGSAKAYVPGTASGGISDLTTGSNLTNAKAVTANHLLLFPRNDGRALQVTDNETYIMVKGTYRIR